MCVQVTTPGELRRHTAKQRAHMKSRRIAGPLLLLLIIASFGMWVHGAVPDVPTGQWLPGPALAQPREGAATVALDDGRVLVIGGRTASGPVSTVEVFNANGSLAVGAHLLSRRAGHTATKLPDGSVLVVGGRTLVTTDDGSGPVTAETVTNAAEVYDVNANLWYPAMSLSIARSGHTATAVADGHVVVAGGVGTDGAALDSFEVFDPEWGVFSSPGLLSAARTKHAAAVADATKVLVAGGRNANGALSTGDIVDVMSGTVSTVMLNAPRTGASATALLDGRILVVGGSDGVNELASAELVDPVTGISVPTASMAQPRREHLALLLANNNTVLITGGRSAGVAASGAEQFIPWTGELSSTGSPDTSRTSALLSNLSADGRAWLAGGRVADGSFPGAGELYGFATIKTDKSDYSPGMTVVMTGSGWQPGEAVSLLLHEVATGHADRTFSAIANDTGDIVNSEFVVDAQHIGVRFMLTARGAASQAQTTFTDGNLQSDIAFDIGPATVSVGDTLTWTATATCNNGGGPNNTCAANGFTLGGAVANTYSLDIQQATNANFNGPSVVTRQVSSTTAGAASGSFTAPAAGTYFYRIRHANQAIGSNTWQPGNSAVVTITVGSCTAAAVTNHPTPQSITYGENASFVAAANGSPTSTVEWQVSTDNGGNWNNLAGATSTMLSLTQPTVAMSGNQYRAVFTNTCNGTKTATTSAAMLTVAKATATVTLSNLTQTYTGSPLTPAATTNPAGLDITWTGAPQTNAGSRLVTATVNDANYQGSSTPGTFVVNKAMSTTITVGDGPFTFDGTTHAGGSGTVTGAGGLSTSATSLTYTGDQVNAGTYYVTAHYAGDANHEASDGAAVAIVINKAGSTTTIACPSTVTYTGLALTPCTATVAGAGGLDQPVNVTYQNNINPGTGTANASYSGDANHEVSSDTKTFAITYGLCSAAVGTGAVILQPINSDGTSVFARKGGSTLPVKFRVCDASGNPISNPAAVFAGTGGSLTMLSAVRGTVDVVNEPGVMEIPDAGFRFSGNLWIFNMATSNLAQGTTYTFRINLASGSIPFRVGVK
jgi:hypothetical protein